MAEAASVDTYVIDFTTFVGVDKPIRVTEQKGIIFPNPVRETALFRFKLDRESEILFTIKDVAGRTVYTDKQKSLPAGMHEIPFTLKSAPPGLYIAIIRTGIQVITTKFEILK